MKMLKKLLFTMVLLVGCSLAAFGQNDDNKNPPPKKGDPKIMFVPKNDGNKPKDSPKDENPKENPKPKKPDNES